MSVRVASIVAAALWVAASGGALAHDGPSPPAASSAGVSSAAQQPARPPLYLRAPRLDLRAPPIDHVLTPQQLQTMLMDRDDDTSEPDDVTVQSAHYADPVPPGAFNALPWALLHPLEAWRIFAPITD